MEYKQVFSTTKPSSIEVGLTTVYLRKDISDFFRTNSETGEVTHEWRYQEAAISKAEFEQMSGALLLVGQESATFDQMTIMEAIADLFETVMMMTENL